LLEFPVMVPARRRGTRLAIAAWRPPLYKEAAGRARGAAAEAMMTKGTRQALVSAAVFGLLLVMLVSVDQRVRERATQMVSRGDGLSSMGDRATDLGGALLSAFRHQSIENAPLLVFATVGAVLVVFMLKV
jgi:hypothetical protein